MIYINTNIITHRYTVWRQEVYHWDSGKDYVTTNCQHPLYPPSQVILKSILHQRSPLPPPYSLCLTLHTHTTNNINNNTTQALLLPLPLLLLVLVLWRTYPQPPSSTTTTSTTTTTIRYRCRRTHNTPVVTLLPLNTSVYPGVLSPYRHGPYSWFLRVTPATTPLFHRLLRVGCLVVVASGVVTSHIVTRHVTTSRVLSLTHLYTWPLTVIADLWHNLLSTATDSH